MPVDATSWPRYQMAYEKLCESYHAIDDFRTKLLGFLPLASGAGIFLLVGKDASGTAGANGATAEAATTIGAYVPAIATFGFFVTLGLLAFELFGIVKCAALISAGRDLEWELEIESVGQFASLPRPLGGIINEPFASGVVYPAVLAAWAYLALLARPERTAVAAALFVAGLAAVVVLELRLRRREGERQKARESRRGARPAPVAAARPTDGVAEVAAATPGPA